MNIELEKKSREKKILEEIMKTGFPLELRVANYLSREDYFVAQSLYYKDNEEDKMREIDIRALKNFYNNKNQWVRQCLIIECKKSSDPWVFLSSKISSYDNYDIFMNNAHEEALYKIDEEIFEKHPYKSIQNIGRSFVEPFKNKSNAVNIYQALYTVAKATNYIVEQWSFRKSIDNLVLLYPMVILEGELYEAILDENGEISLSSKDYLLHSFFKNAGNKETNYLPLMIPIVREEHLSKFLQNLDVFIGIICKYAKESGEVIFNK